MSPLLERLTRDYNRDANLITKYFDSNVRKPIFKDEYLILMEPRQVELHEIEFDSQLKEDISEDFVLDQNKYYRTEEEIWKVIHGMTIDIFETIDSNYTLLDRYLIPLVSKYIYSDDAVPLNANKEWVNENVPEDLVFDSNSEYEFIAEESESGTGSGGSVEDEETELGGGQSGSGSIEDVYNPALPPSILSPV